MGSMKSKRFKAADGAGVSANGGVHKEQPSEVLRARVEELEREARRRDQEAAAKDLHVKVLQEQLTAQTRALAQLSEQLHHKCVQLNKLQGSVKRKTGPGQSGQSDAAVGQSERSVSPVGESGQVGAAAGLCLGQSVKAMSKLSPNLGCLMKEAMDRRRGAKAGVSAEPSSSCLLREFNFEKARVSKDASVKRQLTEALNRNQYLKRLESQQLKDMVECMYERAYQPGEHVVKQGEPGNHLFVLSDGRLDVFQHGKLITTLALWTTFGELAILCNCTRTASVRAVGAVTTWALDREVFQNIMRTTAETRHEQHRCFLRSVSLLANLPEDKLAKIVDCLEVEEFLYAMMDVPFLPISYHLLMEYYDRGEYVIREGEEGSTFYVISKGKVKVTQSTKLHRDPQTINTLYRGDYFGEKALISDDVRSANIIAQENGVECLVIDRVTFDQTVGTFSELQKYLQGYVATLDHQDQRRHAKKSACARQKSQTLSADQVEVRERTPSSPGPPPSLDSLEVLATLGVGGFGRVELVKVRNEDVTFAMKVIKKQHIVNNRQQEHVHSERKILSEARSPFIVKLHQTFKDSKYVYMLLEACLGGEIWSLLRDRGSFEENTAKFCLACVTEAFDYLHRHGILYRDLKPENLMLDADGYIKLVDFGFAKKIQCGQRTWTFCGTPEYVAPEVILNKGHSFSVDFWSLGILLFELLTGSPPFSGSDQMMTYTFILKGLEKIDFPKKITKRPEDLIRKLCRRNPAERLGNLKNGLTDIKKHRWLSGFNWEGLQHRKLTSPLKRELSGPTDHRYFDSYPPDEEVPPDELSGWDMEF